MLRAAKQVNLLLCCLLCVEVQGKSRIPPLVTPSMLEWSNRKGLSLRTSFRFNTTWQCERIYCNLLTVHTLKPYTEIGYSIATHLFDIGIFAGVANRKAISFGWSFALRLFED